MNNIPQYCEISVRDYYLTSRYYPYMPECVFEALESAFLSGSDIALAPRPAVEQMIRAYEEGTD